MMTSCAAIGLGSDARARIEALLKQYPKLSEQDLSELIGLFRDLTLWERRQIGARPELSRKLTAFDRDHGEELAASHMVLAVFFALPLLVTMLIAWWVVA